MAELETEAFSLLRVDKESSAFYKAMVKDLNNGNREMSWRVYIAERAAKHVRRWAKKKAAPVTAKISGMLPPRVVSS